MKAYISTPLQWSRLFLTVLGLLFNFVVLADSKKSSVVSLANHASRKAASAKHKAPVTKA